MSSILEEAATTFDVSMDGKREMLDEARTLELLSKIDSSNTTTITRIKLSNKSFGNEAVAVLAPKLASLINLQVADLSDIIAGRETSIGLNVLSTISEALSQSPHLVEVDLSENLIFSTSFKV